MGQGRSGEGGSSASAAAAGSGSSDASALGASQRPSRTLEGEGARGEKRQRDDQRDYEKEAEDFLKREFPHGTPFDIYDSDDLDLLRDMARSRRRFKPSSSAASRSAARGSQGRSRRRGSAYKDDNSEDR